MRVTPWARIRQKLFPLRLPSRPTRSRACTRHWVERWYPVRVGAEVVGLGAVVREVTEEKAAEAFKSRVLGVVGHDLRNPLATAKIGVDAVRHRLQDDLKAAGLLYRVDNALSRVSEMADALLDYSRFTAGEKVQLRLTEADLAELCEQLVGELRTSHPEARIVYEPPGPCLGRWDPGRLAQVVANLLSNAVAHGAGDQPITLRLLPGADEVAVSVHNLGEPIAPELLPVLFEPFRRGDRRPLAGHGLGLFIAREIADAHGGRVEVRSAAGEGTTFELRLPRRSEG